MQNQKMNHIMSKSLVTSLYYYTLIISLLT